MSEPVRLACPAGRKHVELWSGYALLLLGLVLAIVFAPSWVGIVLGVLLALAGAALAVHGHLIKAPVLEIFGEEFRYRRGNYIVRVHLREIGSYYVLPGRIRSLGLCDLTGRAKRFPSLKSRRTSRTHLPLTGMTDPAKVESFMSLAGIPQRKRSLTS